MEKQNQQQIQTICNQTDQNQKKKPLGARTPTSMYFACALQRTVDLSSSINLQAKTSATAEAMSSLKIAIYGFVRPGESHRTGLGGAGLVRDGGRLDACHAHACWLYTTAGNIARGLDMEL
jgi:hypothetical protein